MKHKRFHIWIIAVQTQKKSELLATTHSQDCSCDQQSIHLRTLYQIMGHTSIKYSKKTHKIKAFKVIFPTL